MMFQEITDILIKKDIDEFSRRIATAQKKLDELPATAETWIGRKKLNAKRRFLEGEIVYVGNLISMAREALEVCDG